MATYERGTVIPKSGRSLVRRLGTTLVILGLGMLGWALVTLQWNDPITSLYTRWQQSRLDDAYVAIVREEMSRPAVSEPGADPAAARGAVQAAARRYREQVPVGGALGRLVIPRLGLDMVVVNGTDSGTLKKGPGRDRRTFMPGEGKLVYVAGHRTTYLAPFAHIDDLRRGDLVRFETPYATLEYAVARFRIVDDEDLSVLESNAREEVALQACHPRFFATQRYVVWARAVRVIPRGGSPFQPLSP